VSPLDSPGAGATPTGEASTREDPGRARRARKPSTRYPESEWQRVHLAKGEHAVEETKEEDAKTEPLIFSEAVSGEDAEFWIKAMDEEMASLLENKTWEVREIPHGVKPVPTKWFYKIKRDEHGNIARYKVRVVAKGFKQTKGVDYEEVFAPVSRHVTVRTLLAVAAAKDLKVEQLDVKTAFLNGELEEEIWMEQPEGFEVGGKNQACYLLKTLYGLKQAPRAWHLKLTAEMESLGFEASVADPSLFVKKAGEETVYVAVWVDDCLLVGEKEAVKETKRSQWREVHGQRLGSNEVLSGNGSDT
jgi:hypothetical protein